jgi:hypothetical protein
LKSVSMACMFVMLESKIKRMSSLVRDSTQFASE